MRQHVLLLFAATSIWGQSVFPPVGSSVSTAGSNGDVQVKNGSSLGAGGINCPSGGGTCTMGDQSTPSNPASGKTAVYSKSGKICSLDPSGNEYCTGSATITLPVLVYTPAAKCQAPAAGLAFS